MQAGQRPRRAVRLRAGRVVEHRRGAGRANAIPPNDTAEPLDRDAIIDLAKTAASNWAYVQRPRLIGWLGRVTHRDLNSCSNLQEIPLPLSRRMRRQDGLYADCLGVAKAAYMDGIGAHDNEARFIMNVKYQEARGRFRTSCLALRHDFWAGAFGIAEGVFKDRESEFKARGKALLCQESRTRHEELEIPLMPDLGRFAMPTETGEQVMKLAESNEDLDRSVASYIADSAREVLTEPFKQFKSAKLGLSVNDKRALASVPVPQLFRYVMAQLRFDKAELKFPADVNEVLAQHRDLPPERMQLELDWRSVPDAPPPVKLALAA